MMKWEDLFLWDMKSNQTISYMKIYGVFKRKYWVRKTEMGQAVEKTCQKWKLWSLGPLEEYQIDSPVLIIKKKSITKQIIINL